MHESMAADHHFSFVPIFSFLLSLLTTIVSCNAGKVPRFFIFGDSLVDTGNNNYIFTKAKANVEPNGIDFAPSGGRPTGRFSNGKTFLDVLVDEFRAACYPPPYLGLGSNDGTLCGVNYASAGGGILNDTGSIFIGRINMDEQIGYYCATRQKLISSLGEEKASELLKNAIFPIVLASNDFLDNYYTPIIGKYKYVPPEVYVEQLIERYKLQLMRLYNLDARSFIVWNVPAIGCMPLERGLNYLSYGGNCDEEMNRHVLIYNRRLKDLINELNSKLPQVMVLYADIHHMFDEVRHSYKHYGFEVVDAACCKNEGPIVDLLPCGEKSTYCQDRSKYLFWDPYHPSEAANILMVERLMDGDDKNIYPFNIRRAMKLLGF
ncbi:Lipase [Macleaya cordata]|uniref:Lipase n=1 Tax=Macleaya cordata TaxID=56857 RepID=A0A200R240_MACCD|nr:Lipase [Macleaya cordata]